MTLPETCQCCKLPLAAERFRLRLEADGTDPRAIELALCGECVKSLERWLTRRQRNGEAGPEVKVPFDPPEKGRTRDRRLKTKRRSRFEESLKRHESWIGYQTTLWVLSIVLGFVGVCALIVVGILAWN